MIRLNLREYSCLVIRKSKRSRIRSTVFALTAAAVLAPVWLISEAYGADASAITPLPAETPLNVAPVAPAAVTATAPNLQGKIASINIAGNINVNADAIRLVLTEKVGADYSAAAADKDAAAIRGMGYFRNDVAVSANVDATNGVNVTFTVVENPFIKRIVFSANTPDRQPTISSAKLLSLMQTQPNHVLNSNTFLHDLDVLFNPQTGYARQQGYVIDVSSDVNVDPLTGTLNIPLIETHIDSITVSGNKKTKPIVLLRELHSKPGDVLDEKRMQRDLVKIYDLGLFDQVGPFEENPIDVGRVGINIPVVERRSGQISVGVGYSSRSKLVGRADIAENNFRGLGERVSLQWEVGGVNTSSSLELGFTEPYLDKHHTSLDVDVYDKAIYRFTSDSLGSLSNSSTYTEKRRGGIVSLSRPLSETASAGIGFRGETVRTEDDATLNLNTYIRQNGTVYALNTHFTNNDSDNVISPASGGLESASMELGTADTTTANNGPSPLTPGRHGFAKFGLDLRRYISLQGPRKLGDVKSAKKVLALRMLLGTTNKDIPFFEQYFIGGADSLRGYQTDRYWGNNLALFQSELRIPIGKDNSFQAVLLGDIGDAWGSIYQQPTLAQHSSFKPQGDYGVGIRLVTPLGPIRLDYAIGKDGGRTQFSIGQSF